jgi:hypothetical protein
MIERGPEAWTETHGLPKRERIEVETNWEGWKLGHGAMIGGIAEEKIRRTRRWGECVEWS